jgi:hypothetical protein
MVKAPENSGAYAADSISGLLKGIDSKFGWLRGLAML